jgi:hypothetical protein
VLAFSPAKGTIVGAEVGYLAVHSVLCPHPKQICGRPRIQEAVSVGKRADTRCDFGSLIAAAFSLPPALAAKHRSKQVDNNWSPDAAAARFSPSARRRSSCAR